MKKSDENVAARYCVDCFHCEYKNSQAEYVCNRFLDLVTKDPEPCEYCRAEESLCGKSGKGYDCKYGRA